MEQNMLVGPPEPGSEREKLFNDYSQQMRDTVQRVITKRHSGEEEENIPFIDNLLQSGASDEQVSSTAVNIHNGAIKCIQLYVYITHLNHVIAIPLFNYIYNLALTSALSLGKQETETMTNTVTVYSYLTVLGHSNNS